MVIAAFLGRVVLVTADVLARMTDLLGVPCLGYLLGRSPRNADPSLTHDDLTAEQSAVLQALGDLLPFDLTGGHSDFQTRFQVAQILGQYLPSAGCSRAVVIRRASG